MRVRINNEDKRSLILISPECVEDRKELDKLVPYDCSNVSKERYWDGSVEIVLNNGSAT